MRALDHSCPLTYLSLQVLAVNVNGVLYTAQAAGQQMDRFGNGGSIIMIASICGHLTIKVRARIVNLLMVGV